MTVPTSINDLSTTAGSNSPAGGDPPGQGDDFFRAYGSFIASLRDMLNGTTSASIKDAVFSGSWTGTYNIGGSYTFTTNPAGKIASASFTCIGTSIANVSNVTVGAASYVRVGDYVLMSVYCAVSPTVAGGGQFYLSLPIASNFASASDAIGTLNGSTTSVEFHGKVLAETSGDRLDCSFFTSTASPMAVCVTATYKVI